LNILNQIYDADPKNSDLPLQQVITAIAENFPIFSCFECASAIQSLLTKREISGKQLILSTGSAQKTFCNIYCDRFNQNISINGRHTEIAVSPD
jgi:hypothetical protein